MIEVELIYGCDPLLQVPGTSAEAHLWEDGVEGAAAALMRSKLEVIGRLMDIRFRPQVAENPHLCACGQVRSRHYRG